MKQPVSEIIGKHMRAKLSKLQLQKETRDTEGFHLLLEMIMGIRFTRQRMAMITTTEKAIIMVTILVELTCFYESAALSCKNKKNLNINNHNYKLCQSKNRQDATKYQI